ncbi:GlxA family transcriptional regulator [Marinicellulosiphila megalodicopiae]|uniref:GlxA family transcriptional regulator n=1 Tax=Marinicellulosiphila megalodicopiae TaxID=2724896 RepID=UPI003BAFF423
MQARVLYFLVYPKALATGICLPVEMFHAVNTLSKVKSKQDAIQVKLVSVDGNAVEVTGGLKLHCDLSLDETKQADGIFIPPMWSNPNSVLNNSHKMQTWIKNQVDGGAQVVATGTGVSLLAQTGLLDGKVATTHWYYFDAFQKRFPKVRLQKKQFITHTDSLYCTGSINAQTDLVLYLINQYVGKEALALVEKHFSHEINRTYSAPFEETTIHHDEVIIEVQQWLNQNWKEHINLETMAKFSKMSVRNFSRRFKQATSLSAQQYLIKLKLDKAQELLKQTNLSTAQIADQTGFDDPAYFSRLFKKQFDCSPVEYRKLVRAKSFRL